MLGVSDADAYEVSIIYVWEKRKSMRQGCSDCMGSQATFDYYIGILVLIWDSHTSPWSFNPKPLQHDQASLLILLAVNDFTQVPRNLAVSISVVFSLSNRLCKNRRLVRSSSIAPGGRLLLFKS